MKVNSCPDCGSLDVSYSKFNSALVCRECGGIFPDAVLDVDLKKKTSRLNIVKKFLNKVSEKRKIRAERKAKKKSKNQVKKNVNKDSSKKKVVKNKVVKKKITKKSKLTKTKIFGKSKSKNTLRRKALK